jgi:mRNA interferase RelE/StbE
MGYSVNLTKAADGELDALPARARERSLARITGLGDAPRPPGCARLVTEEGDMWRVRVGDYRILYTIDDQGHEVRIFRIRQRKDAYRRV